MCTPDTILWSGLVTVRFPLPLPEEWNNCIWLTETSWPILIFTFRCQTGSCYWWHCTVTTTDSTIHFSSCLQKENTDYLNALFICTCEIYWCSETMSHVTPCTIFCFNIHMRYTDVLKLYHMSLPVQYPTVMSAGHIQQHSVSQFCLISMYHTINIP